MAQPAIVCFWRPYKCKQSEFRVAYCRDIDHAAQNFHSSPPDGTDTDKQNSSLSHLTGINGTNGGVIYSLVNKDFKQKIMKKYGKR